MNSMIILHRALTNDQQAAAKESRFTTIPFNCRLYDFSAFQAARGRPQNRDKDLRR